MRSENLENKIGLIYRTPSRQATAVFASQLRKLLRGWMLQEHLWECLLQKTTSWNILWVLLVVSAWEDVTVLLSDDTLQSSERPIVWPNPEVSVQFQSLTSVWNGSVQFVGGRTWKCSRERKQNKTKGWGSLLLFTPGQSAASPYTKRTCR